MTAFWRNGCIALVVLLAFSAMYSFQIVAAAEEEARVPDDARLVAWFDALRRGEIEVKVIPRNSERITLEVRNNTPQPLRIRAPEAAVALPVVAAAAETGGKRKMPAPPQALGVSFPGPGLNNAEAPNVGPFRGEIMGIAAGRTIKVRLSAVCLEYHKHEPRATNEYELRPCEDFSRSQALKELLLEFGTGRHSQRAVQAAAWRLADELSFKQLAAMTTQNEAGQKVYRFQPEEIAAAEELVQGLPAIRRGRAERP